MRHKNLILSTVGWAIVWIGGLAVQSKPWMAYVAAMVSGVILGWIAAKADRYDELLTK